MRGRLLVSEAALADYEILEMLLFLGIPRRDTKPLAKGLINRFGSLAEALEADRGALAEAGVTPLAVEAFDMVVEAAGVLARPEAIRRVVLGDWAALEKHLDVPRRCAEPPGLSVLLLNNRNQLLAEPSWEPEEDRGVLIQDMLRHALDQHATAAILVQNRAKEAPRIAAQDRDFYARMQRASAPLSVLVHDLVVIGRGDWVSLRRQGR